MANAFTLLSHSPMTANKKITINMAMAFTATVANICVGFFLTPYIVRTIGTEAQGFTMMATNFISYAYLLVVALNSMAARFITFSVQQGDMEKAGKYYASVFYGNIAIVLALIPLHWRVS